MMWANDMELVPVLIQQFQSNFDYGPTPDPSFHDPYLQYQNIYKASPYLSMIPPIIASNLYQFLQKYVLSITQLEENGFPRTDPNEKGKALVFREETNIRHKARSNPFERICSRCGKIYAVNKKGMALIEEQCVFHYGRANKRRGIGGIETRYSCCQGESDSEGCGVAKCHVSENFDPNNLRGFVRTLYKQSNDSSQESVYALDCEMCYTTAGNELTRVTVIGPDLQTVYETLVKPINPIIDYNTRFSGITEEDMLGVTTTLRDVQAVLLSWFSSKTILIGHSLESDFKALKLIHDTVVDTSVVFPHKMGPPYKRALKNLSAEYLKRIIQDDVGGHDSAEDAKACMELMIWKIREDLKSL